MMQTTITRNCPFGVASYSLLDAAFTVCLNATARTRVIIHFSDIFKFGPKIPLPPLNGVQFRFCG